MTKYLLKPSPDAPPVGVGIQSPTDKSKNHYVVQIGGRQQDIELEMTGNDAGWIRLGGRIIPFRTARKSDTFSIWLAGRTYSIDLVNRSPKRAGGGGAAAKQAQLTAPMPGTILKINVKPGDSFEAHAALVVMESMKMEMTLSAPHAGKVKEVLCKPAQLVDMSAVLVTFKESGDAGAA
jgi:acetyl-CoA/propionyl-CoA carboxylase biotin carboxyl carrier protein